MVVALYVPADEGTVEHIEGGKQLVVLSRAQF